MANDPRKWSYHNYGPSHSRLDFEAYESYQKKCRELWEHVPPAQEVYEETAKGVDPHIRPIGWSGAQ